MQRPLFIGSEIYRGSSYGSWHPLRVPRVSTVIDLSRAMGWLPPDVYLPSPRAKPQALTIWHTPDYLSALHAAEATQMVSAEVKARHSLGTPNNPVFPEMYRRPATAAGGSLLAGELLRDGGIVYHPAGGTHHAMPDRAGGFCYLNDPVLAILALQRNGVQRVAYVDIDAHHPDGVEVAFADDPDVLMISVHEEGLWPRTGPLGATETLVNLPVPRGLNDDEMALIRDQVILPRVATFKPDAIVLQCGADGVEEDPQAHLSLSNNAHWDIVRALMGLAPRLLVLGGGGYNPWSVGRLWTGVWATLNGQEIPDHVGADAEEVLRALRFDGNRRGKNPPAHWFTMLRDTPRNGPIRDEVRDKLFHLAR
ncbi:acetoin utilization protein AcuC [uncultured Tateyamaria sp.]|uniref:acetoin utilization protein AcuC n=1 Tax=uncultured Tateyamaria sp. TaxID=455651 RepID=UPI002633F4B9|nr:acetoin utilization protein AcuC [uncultured Tateyamaria sp.]